jgi:hypothetical protein
LKNTNFDFDNVFLLSINTTSLSLRRVVVVLKHGNGYPAEDVDGVITTLNKTKKKKSVVS